MLLALLRLLLATFIGLGVPYFLVFLTAGVPVVPDAMVSAMVFLGPGVWALTLIVGRTSAAIPDEPMFRSSGATITWFTSLIVVLLCAIGALTLAASTGDTLARIALNGLGILSAIGFTLVDETWRPIPPSERW